MHDRLASLAIVKDLHDLHIWQISSTSVSLMVHVLSDEPANKVISEINRILNEEFEIYHSCVQVEQP